ncbi:MAG: DUF72 domain-containing protein [Candidatus Methylomirabilia bacterium]
MGGRVFIGTSGYVYPHWRGPFYPAELPQRAWLPFYAERFDTAELNNPFYRLPEAERFQAWRQAVPKGFVFAVKVSRYITHVKRLKDVGQPLRTFLTRAKRLGPSLGPILFQLPGNFKVDINRLNALCAWLDKQRTVPGLRAVLEVRHPSWLEPGIFDRLSEANMALCLADWHELPVEDPVTADFVYLRRHGTGVRYGGSYPDGMLRGDATRLRSWLETRRDVYIYFNNDQAAFAVQNARRLMELMS